jgi:hypothetical protein
LRGADPIHHRGEEIDDPDIDRNPLARMMVAQEMRQLFHRQRDRPEIVAIGAIEAFAGMGVNNLSRRSAGAAGAARAGQGVASKPVASARNNRRSIGPALKSKEALKGRPQMTLRFTCAARR